LHLSKKMILGSSFWMMLSGWLLLLVTVVTVSAGDSSSPATSSSSSSRTSVRATEAATTNTLSSSSRSRALQQQIRPLPQGANLTQICWNDTEKLRNITDLAAALNEVQDQGVSFGWADPEICQYPSTGITNCSVAYDSELADRVQQPCEANHHIYSVVNYQIYCSAKLNQQSNSTTEEEEEQEDTARRRFLQTGNGGGDSSETYYQFINVPGCVADACQEDGALNFLDYLTSEMQQNFEEDLATPCQVQNLEIVELEDYLTPLEVCLLETATLAEESEALANALMQSTDAIAALDFDSICTIQPNQATQICAIDAMTVVSVIEDPPPLPDEAQAEEEGGTNETLRARRQLTEHDVEVAQVCNAEEEGLYIVSSFSLRCQQVDNTTTTVVQLDVENFPDCIHETTCEAPMYKNVAQGHAQRLANRLVELQPEWDLCVVLDTITPEVEDFSPSAAPSVSAMPTLSSAPSQSPTVATPSPTAMPVVVDLTDPTCDDEDFPVSLYQLNELFELIIMN
jgi:hypothetical protein